MQLEDVRKRMERLTRLSLGLSRELVAWEEAKDPLLYLERKAYLAAIREAIDGVETARVVLVKACQRITRETEAGQASSLPPGDEQLAS